MTAQDPAASAPPKRPFLGLTRRRRVRLYAGVVVAWSGLDHAVLHHGVDDRSSQFGPDSMSIGSFVTIESGMAVG